MQVDLFYHLQQKYVKVMDMILDIVKKNGKWKRGLHKVRKHHLRGATKEAIEARDYAAWQEIVKDKGKRGEIINTEEKFNLFVDMIELRKEGKKDEAKAIADELGLKGHHRFQKKK